MKGNVIRFDLQEGRGIISGDDDKRYTFLAMEWQESDCPVKGQRVDYVAVGENAEDIYALSVSENVDEAMARQAREYGWYKSSDEKMIAGVCVGLARRLNISMWGTRAATLLVSLVFVVPIIVYFVLWLVLPSKPSKFIKSK